jgi:hypothetical protein
MYVHTRCRRRATNDVREECPVTIRFPAPERPALAGASILAAGMPALRWDHSFWPHHAAVVAGTGNEQDGFAR